MDRDLKALADREFDVVVVGGGACGAAVAYDAAQRGLSVALLERHDFCAHTSAHSLKIVHGGIRYLQHLDVARVRESCRERTALLRIAPHLVQPLPIVVPTYGHGMRGRAALHAAFWLLAALTPDRNRGLRDAAQHIPRGRLLSRADVLAWCPGLASPDLTGAGLFHDGRIHDAPRLVWAFVRSAADAGACVANYCEATGLARHNGTVRGVDVHDRLGGERFTVRGRVVVNAAGPYAEPLLVRAGARPRRTIPFSRDMALVLGRQLLTGRALAVQTRYHDPDAVLSRGARHLFLVPWRGYTLVGVDSVVWEREPDDLTVTEAEVARFVNEIAAAAPWLGVRRDDVSHVYAGLVPFGQNASGAADLRFGHRSHLVDHATEGLPGLISAVSIRLTVARGLAERAVDLAFRRLGRRPPPCRTASLPLAGGDFASFDALTQEIATSLPTLPRAAVEGLARRHGSRYGGVAALLARRPELARLVTPEGPLAAEVVHAARAELARTLEDVVLRRTDLGTGAQPQDDALRTCAGLMAGEMGWSPQQTEQQLGLVRARYAAWQF